MATEMGGVMVRLGITVVGSMGVLNVIRRGVCGEALAAIAGVGAHDSGQRHGAEAPRIRRVHTPTAAVEVTPASMLTV